MTGAIPFHVWRAARTALELEVQEASNHWRALPGAGAGPMGLTPDSIKASPEWQAAYARFWRAQEALCRHNGAARHYRFELAQERKARRAAIEGALP